MRIQMKVLDRPNCLLILIGLPPRLFVNYLHTSFYYKHNAQMRLPRSRAKWSRSDAHYLG